MALPCLFFASTNLHAAIITTFNVNGTFAGGGSLVGTVGIEVNSGEVLTADLTATVTRTYDFTTNVGGIPNYGGIEDLFVIVANHLGGYPISLLGVQEATLKDYKGGPLVGGSNVVFDDLVGVPLSSGSLSIGNVEYVGPNTIVDFNADGSFVGGGALDGTVTVNITTGEVMAANLLATVTRSYHLSAGVGGIPNYGGINGLFVIVANEERGGYPIGLFGLNETSLVGFDGGTIVGGSNISFEDGVQIALTSGTISPVPEASTLALVSLAGVGGILGYRRRARA
jgi:hypothetical protein